MSSQHFMSFEQWLRENADLAEQLVNQDCDKCCGEGECFTCGAECSDCAGSGHPGRQHLRYMYDRMKDNQLKKLQQWNDAVKEVA